MSEVHGSESRLYLAGKDLSAMFQELEGGTEVELVDSTGFGAVADRHIVSPLVKRMMDATGMLDVDPSTGVAVQLDTLKAAQDLGVANVAVWMLRDTTLGDPGLAVIGSVPRLTVKNVMTDVAKTMFGTRSVVSGWCRALKNKGAIVAAGNGAALDNAVLTSLGGISTLEVMALTGTTPVLTVKTQHSVDNVTWVDLATHTVINAAGVTAGYSDAQQVAGTVNRYLRHTLAVTSGTLTSVTLAHQFARL